MKAELIALLAGATLTLAAAPARAIDVAPGDYVIAPSGTNIALLYLQHQSADSFELNGSDIPGSELGANVMVLRGLHYSEAFGMPALYHAILPVVGFDTARIGGADQGTSEGVGDLTLGFTVWPVQPDNPDTGTTLGVSMFVTAPTGNYDVTEIGAGSGAWTLTPQIGLVQGLGNGFFLDGVVDAAFSFDHDENGATVSRETAYQAQIALRKQFSPTTSVSLGLSSQTGGKVEIGGVDTGLRTRRDQVRLYANTFLSPTVQLQGMLAKDIEVDGGFKSSSVVELRLLKLF